MTSRRPESPPPAGNWRGAAGSRGPPPCCGIWRFRTGPRPGADAAARPPWCAAGTVPTPRRDVAHDRRRLALAPRVSERDEAAGDGGRARPAVRLNDLAVDHDAPRAERLEVDRRAEGSAHEPLDLEGPAARPSRDALALAALGRAPRQHRVLGGDPPGALALEELRHAVLQRREAEHLGVAEGDLGRSFGELRDADVDGDRAQRRRCAAVRPREGHAVSSQIRRISGAAYDSRARPSAAARASTRP